VVAVEAHACVLERAFAGYVLLLVGSWGVLVVELEVRVGVGAGFVDDWALNGGLFVL
jgi:hypothetical protein